MAAPPHPLGLFIGWICTRASLVRRRLVNELDICASIATPEAISP